MITIFTNIGVNGESDTLTVEQLVEMLNSSSPTIALGPDIGLVKDDVRSVYNGPPAADALNQYEVTMRNGETYVVSLPEGENAINVIEAINKHAEGELDRFGNRVVKKPFLVIGNGTSVGFRYNEFRTIRKISTETTPQ